MIGPENKDRSIMESIDNRIFPPELLKISIFNSFGIFLVITSIFFPWFGNPIHNSPYVGFWYGYNIFLGMSLTFLLIGSFISFFSSISPNLKKKHRKIGFLGIILILISILVFLWAILSNPYYNSTGNLGDITQIGFYIACCGTVILFVSELFFQKKFQVIYQQGIDNHSLYNENKNIEKSPHLRNKTLRISILSVIGVIFGIQSLFKPWFYQNKFLYESGVLTSSSITRIFFIDWIWNWDYFQYHLVISLILFIIGLMFSLIFSMEMGFRRASTNMNWLGMIFMMMSIIVYYWSLYTFPYSSLNHGWIRTEYSIPYPDIGLMYSVVSFVLVILGFFCLKTKNRILQRLTIHIKISSKNQIRHDKSTRFSTFSVIGVFLMYVSIYMPWFYTKSESYHLHFFLTFLRYQATDFYQYAFIHIFLPFSDFQVSIFLVIFISFFITILFLFEYPKLKNLTIVSLIAPLLYITIFFMFNFKLLSWVDSILPANPLYIPHIGSIMGFIGASLMLLGYISLKNKSERLSKSVFSIYN